MASKTDRGIQGGFTLVELMVVTVIVAILAAIAIPTYRQQVLRSNRANAKAALMQTAQVLERCYTRTSTFVDCAVLPYTTPENLYTIDGDVDSTTYTLTAAPQGGQAEDTACGTFSLNEANVRDVTGTGEVDDCWSR